MTTSVTTFRYIISGKTNSGKTHLCKYLLYKLRNEDIEVFIFSSTAKPEHWPMVDEKKIINVFDERLINDIRASETVFGNHKIIVVDDFLADVKPNNKTLANLFTKGRHTNTSVILITQRLNGFSPTIRVNASCIFLTKTISRSDLQLLYSEYGTVRFRTKYQFFEYIIENTKAFGVIKISENDDEYISLYERRPDTLPKFIVGTIDDDVENILDDYEEKRIVDN